MLSKNPLGIRIKFHKITRIHKISLEFIKNHKKEQEFIILVFSFMNFYDFFVYSCEIINIVSSPVKKS
jgi:hypothetical protein